MCAFTSKVDEYHGRRVRGVRNPGAGGDEERFRGHGLLLHRGPRGWPWVNQGFSACLAPPWHPRPGSGPRAAGLVSGALDLMQERIAGPYSCGAQGIPGLLRYGDVPKIGGLIAPRPCVWEVGSRDRLIAPERTAQALARLRRAYLGCRGAAPGGPF